MGDLHPPVLLLRPVRTEQSLDTNHRSIKPVLGLLPADLEVVLFCSAGWFCICSHCYWQSSGNATQAFSLLPPSQDSFLHDSNGPYNLAVLPSHLVTSVYSLYFDNLSSHVHEVSPNLPCAEMTLYLCSSSHRFLSIVVPECMLNPHSSNYCSCFCLRISQLNLFCLKLKSSLPECSLDIAGSISSITVGC
uniref:Uncharacterized protein n=1 Tax=Arundo donax TaxID=35708 RepID=A0A0A9D7L7_ARUDO